LRIKKDRLEQLIDFALVIQMLGVKSLNYQTLNEETLESYKSEARKSWGAVPMLSAKMNKRHRIIQRRTGRS